MITLIRLSFILKSGDTTDRFCTTLQDRAAITARYFTSIPNAVACTTSIEGSISPAKAMWLYQSQHIDFAGASFKKKNNRLSGHYKLRSVSP